MTPLPEADAPARAFFEAWLERFSGYVRDVDYASARRLWHPDVVIFGTHQDVVQGRETCIATQWDNVWPKTADFRFDLARTRVLVSDDGSLATVIAPWTSTGFHPDGARFDRRAVPPWCSIGMMQAGAMPAGRSCTATCR